MEWTRTMCSGGLNPILGFCFPPFSTCFPAEFPSGWKSTESSGKKIVVNCSQSTYMFYLRFNYFISFPPWSGLCRNRVYLSPIAWLTCPMPSASLGRRAERPGSKLARRARPRAASCHGGPSARRSGDSMKRYDFSGHHRKAARANRRWISTDAVSGNQGVRENFQARIATQIPVNIDPSN